VVKKLKYDCYLENLCDKIRSDYDELFKNVELISKKTKRKVAEIDILAEEENKYHVYEVKCSYRIVKAKKQLKKIKKLLPNVKKLFFFCRESGMLLPFPSIMLVKNFIVGNYLKQSSFW